MAHPNNWYVITGGPSTGKTTLLAELEKLGYRTIPEAARTVIDQAVAQGITAKELRKDEKYFQEEVTRLKQKIELAHNPEVATFFDRGMHDTLAYLRHYKYAVEEWVHALMHSSRYQKVFLLEPLARYERDYARTEDEGFVTNIHTLLHDAYAEFGMPPIRVKAGSVEERLKFIVAQIKAR